MKVTVKEQSGLAHSYNVVVPAEDVERHIEHELKAIGQRTKIPGFRPGKVPMNILKQRYGKNVMGEVLQNSVNNATRDLMEEKQLRPVTQPDIAIQNYEDGSDLTFDISFEVLPEVSEPDYSKITVSKQVCEVKEEEIDAGIKQVSNQRKQFHVCTEGHAAKEGDAVKIDFLGKLDGEAFDGGAANDFQLELGSGQFIPGFEEQLVGCKPGDKKDVKVTFPDVYHNDDLAGKDVVFEVTVHEVLHAQLPEVNDEFAKEFGVESVEALKEAIGQQLAAEYEQASREKCKKQLFDILDEQVEMDVPETLMNQEFDAIWTQVSQAKLKGDDPSLDKPDEELKEEYQAIARRRVKLGIMLSEIGRKNNLQVSREELSQAVMRQAQQFPGQEQKVFEFYQKNPDEVEQLKGPIIEEKAVDFILGKISLKEEKVDAETLFAQEDVPAGAQSTQKKKPAAKKSTAKKTAKKKTNDQ